MPDKQAAQARFLLRVLTKRRHPGRQQAGLAAQQRFTGYRKVAQCLHERLLVFPVPFFNYGFCAFNQFTDTSALIRHLLRDTSETDDETIWASLALLFQRIEIRQLKKGGLQFRAQETQRQFHCLLSRGESEREYRLGFRPRTDFECGFDNHPKSAERTTVELGQVIASHILDHAPTAFNHRAIRLDDFEADEEVADRPLRQTHRAAQVSCNSTTNSCLLR
jgi:hypothetical protein